jgi:hypothetical protein
LDNVLGKDAIAMNAQGLEVFIPGEDTWEEWSNEDDFEIGEVENLLQEGSD